MSHTKPEKYTIIVEAPSSSGKGNLHTALEKSMQGAMRTLTNKGYKVSWTLHRTPICTLKSSTYRRELDMYNRNCNYEWGASNEQ